MTQKAQNRSAPQGAQTDRELNRKRRELRDYLTAQPRVELIEAVLPPNLEAIRIINIAIAEAVNDPTGKLLNCDPLSILMAVAQMGRLGLEVGGVAGEAYLIPYTHKKGPMAGRTVANPQAGYRGWLKIVRSEVVGHVRASVVRENDPEFTFQEAPLEVRHVPLIGTEKERGPVRCAYAVALTPDRELFDAAWLGTDQIKRARDSNPANSPAWGNWADEMAKKVAVKRLCKTLPLLHQAAMRAAQLSAIEDRGDAMAYYDAELDPIRQRVEESRPALPPAGRSRGVELKELKNLKNKREQAEPVRARQRPQERRAANGRPNQEGLPLDRQEEPAEPPLPTDEDAPPANGNGHVIEGQLVTDPATGEVLADYSEVGPPPMGTDDAAGF